jgi:hypothetical protein
MYQKLQNVIAQIIPCNYKLINRNYSNEVVHEEY